MHFYMAEKAVPSNRYQGPIKLKHFPEFVSLDYPE